MFALDFKFSDQIYVVKCRAICQRKNYENDFDTFINIFNKFLCWSYKKNMPE